MQKQNSNLTDCLSQLLANTFLLALKTHNYHWNVTGANFYSLHILLEKQYNDLYQASDTIAERIRALGKIAPGTCKKFTELAIIEEAKYNITADEMLDDLITSHNIIINYAKELIKTCKQDKDEASLDLVIERIKDHDFQSWMLNSSLSKSK